MCRKKRPTAFTIPSMMKNVQGKGDAGIRSLQPMRRGAKRESSCAMCEVRLARGQQLRRDLAKDCLTACS